MAVTGLTTLWDFNGTTYSDDMLEPLSGGTVGGGTSTSIQGQAGQGWDYDDSGRYRNNQVSPSFFGLQGGHVELTSAQDLSAADTFLAMIYRMPDATKIEALSASKGVKVLAYSSTTDGSTEALWPVDGEDTLYNTYGWNLAVINVARSTDAHVYGIDDSNVTNVGIAADWDGSFGALYVDSIVKMQPFQLTGDDSGGSYDFSAFEDYALSFEIPIITVASSVYTVPCSIRVGDGSTATKFEHPNLSIVTPPQPTYSGTKYARVHIDANDMDITFNPAASDTLDIDGLSIAYGSRQEFGLLGTNGIAVSNGAISGSGTTQITDSWALTGWLFSNCNEIEASQPELINTTIRNAAGTGLLLDTDNGLANASAVAFNSNAVGIEVEITGDPSTCDIDITSHTFSSNTVDILYSGTGTLTIAGTSAQEAALTTSAPSGTIVWDTPADTFTINVSESGALIQIFTTTTQTVLDSATSNTLAFLHSGQTVDYVVQKAGFLPQRVVGLALSGSPTVSVTLLADPVYNASHGLTFTTDYSYNTTTRLFSLVAAQQGRDVYSAFIDDCISETGLRNIPFPLMAIGIDRIDFTSDGTTASGIESGSIQYWLGAGMEWQHATTGAKTHKFCSVVGTGTNAAGTKGYVQQVDGASPTALTLVSNNINQVIQYYSDPNGDGSVADGYDYSDHMVVKLFNDGYYQASSNLLTAYGASAIESFEYVIPMEMAATGLSTGDRSITITVTDNTPSGVEEQTGYTFDYKIEGGASDSPEDLLRQWIYDVYTDPTASDYASTVNFNWPDPIFMSGDNYETKRGYVYGQDTTTTYSGFYVEEGSDYHPDFSRQQANDESYFTTPTLAGISASNLTAGHVELYNVTTDTLIESVTNTTGYSKTWTNGTDATAGDTVRLRWRGYKSLPIEASIVATTGTTQTVLTAPSTDTSAATYETALSTTGADIDATGEFALDGSNVQIDIDDPDDIYYMGRLYLWYSYKMVSATGISTFWNAVESPSASVIQLNRSVVAVLLDNLNVNTARQGDQIVLTTDDGTFPVLNPTTGGGGLTLYFEGIGYTVETGVSGLTGPESTRLMATSTHSAQDVTDSIMAEVMEDSETFKEQQNIIRAVSAGKVVKNGNDIEFRDKADAKNRLVSTVDTDGQRTAVVSDGT